MFEDKKIGLPLARQPDHIFVVVLDPTAHDFPISQLDADRLLLFSQGLQVSRLFRRFGRRRSSSLLAGWSFSMEWHNGIVHGRFGQGVGTSRTILRVYKSGG